MKKKGRSRISILWGLVAALIIGSAAPVAAQIVAIPQDKDQKSDISAKPLKFYIHGSVGLGLDWMSSDDLSKLMAPFDLTSFGFNYYAGLRIGISNIFQYERRADASETHDFVAGDTTLSMRHTIPRIDLFKFNPLFWLREKAVAFFLVYGKGKSAKFRDEDGIFIWANGDVNIYGIEACAITKYLEASLGLDYRSIRYNTIDVSGSGPFPVPFTSGFFVVSFGLGFGWGF
jgi:hypothetical protein